MKKILLLVLGIILISISIIITFGWWYYHIKENFSILFPVVILVIGSVFLVLAWQEIAVDRRIKAAEGELSLKNKKLQESEARYVLAIQGSHTGLWDWKIGTDHLFLCPILQTMLGFKEDELPNSLQAFRNRLHPDDRDKEHTLIEQHIEKHQPYDIEYRLKLKSGEYHWFHAVAQALWDQKGQAIRMAGSIIDITERKKAQQRLAAQYAVTRVLSETSNLKEATEEIVQQICEHLGWEFGAIWMVDEESNYLVSVGMWCQPHLKAQIQPFLEVTRTIKFSIGTGLPGRVWLNAKPGWIEDVVIDKNFPRAPYAELADLHAAFAFPILLQKEVLGIIEFFTREIQIPDEQLLNMMAAIGPQIGQYIQRKSIESELRESEAYKTAILESASDCIVIINVNHTILSSNPQTEKIFGYSLIELENKKIDELIPDLSGKMNELIGKAAIEATAIRKNGESFPAELTIAKTSLGKKNIYVSVIRDITERKKLENIKSEFISIVSHELRTPLTSIKGAIGLLHGYFANEFSEKAKQLLDIANNNCERLIRLINDILHIEKIEAGKMTFHFKQINIKNIIHDAVKANEEYARGFNVKINIAHEEDAYVFGDYDRLMQVMTNLLSNAIKFSPKNDAVTVEITTLENVVRVSIHDQGEGIPEEFQPKIFSKFAQADTSTTREVGGTGLGLSISKAIIEKHNGKINFYSKRGQGTTFYFDLSTIPVQKSITKAVISENLARVLVVEDDEDCANLLRFILEVNNFTVDVAGTAYEAKELLTKNVYQAMTLDIILPDQNGISLLKDLQAKSELRQLPIIIISILAKEGQEELSGNAFPIVGLIEKPIDKNLLLDLTDKIKKSFYHKTPLILHVEDDPEIVSITKMMLEDKAKIINTNTIRAAKEWLNKEEFDLIILDLKLPDGSGIELLPTVNWKTKRVIPVLVFSAYELNQDYAKYVYASLMKSTTTNETLLNTIKSAIKNNYQGS